MNSAAAALTWPCWASISAGIASRRMLAAAMTSLPPSKRARMPVNTGRDSSREAERETRATVSSNASLSTLNVPIASTNGGESLLALVDGKFVNLRVPYPLGFFTKNVDGRIDDANAGWKGRGLWTTSGTRTVFHNEGGTQNRPKAYKLQIRPNPLAN